MEKIIRDVIREKQKHGSCWIRRRLTFGVPAAVRAAGIVRTLC